MTDLTTLIERVRGLTGADRDIAEHIDKIPFRSTKRGREWLIDSHGGVETWARHPPLYTGSVDAALAFLERVLPCTVRPGFQQNPDGSWNAAILRIEPDEGECPAVTANTPALAIILAAIDALINSETRHDHE